MDVLCLLNIRTSIKKRDNSHNFLSYLPIVSYVQGAIAHPQVWSRKLLQDDEFPSDLSHGGHQSTVIQNVPVGVALDVVYHGTVDVTCLTELLPEAHQHRLRWILKQEVSHTLQDLSEVGPLVGYPMVEGEVPLDVTHTDVQEADTGTELGRQTPGLALSIDAAVQGHGVVGSGHGDLRQRLMIRDFSHPGGVQELWGGCVIIVRSLSSTITQTSDPKT